MRYDRMLCQWRDWRTNSFITSSRDNVTVNPHMSPSQDKNNLNSIFLTIPDKKSPITAICNISIRPCKVAWNMSLDIKEIFGFSWVESVGEIPGISSLTFSMTTITEEYDSRQTGLFLTLSGTKAES